MLVHYPHFHVFMHEHNIKKFLCPMYLARLGQILRSLLPDTRNMAGLDMAPIQWPDQIT